MPSYDWDDIYGDSGAASAVASDDDAEGGQDWSFTGPNSWSTAPVDSSPDDAEGGQDWSFTGVPEGGVYAGEEFYNPETGVQEVQAPTGMSSDTGGTFTDSVTGEEVSTEVSQEDQDEQFGGVAFNWEDYTPGGTVVSPLPDQALEVGSYHKDWSPDDTTATDPVSGRKEDEWVEPKAGDVISLTKARQDFLSKYQHLSKTHGGAHWMDERWVADNWSTIQSILTMQAANPYGYGSTIDAIVPFMEQAKSINQGATPEAWTANWKGLNDTSGKRLGPNQERIMDYWKGADPVKGFYGKTFSNQNVTIATHKGINATSWEGVLDYFRGHPDIPTAIVLAELESKGQHFPRTTEQGDELGEMVAKTLIVSPEKPGGPQGRNIGDSLQGPLELIWQKFNNGIIKTPEALNSELLNAYARAMFPNGFEDQVMTFARMQEGIAGSKGKGWGGAFQRHLDEAEIWAAKTVSQMSRDSAAGKQEFVPAQPTTVGEIDTPTGGSGRDFPMPKNAEEALAILNTLSREDDDFDMVYEMYNMYARQGGGGGGAGTGTDQDLQNKLTNATMTINALRQSAELTAQQHGLLNDWEREMQGESQRLRGIEADRLGTQQQLERDRMLGETTGQIGGVETYESRLFGQRGAQEAQRQTDVAAAAQTAAEAEASRLKIAEGGIASQAQQAQAATDQVANAHRIAEAQLSGWLAGYGDTRGVPTLAATELRNTQALKEAELSGTLWQQVGNLNSTPQYKGVETIAMRTFALNKDIAERKMSLDREIQIAASRREDLRVQLETSRVRNQNFIEQGQLAEAVDSRRMMNRLKEEEMEDARNTMRLNTLMTLMNPTAMLMAQRMGMIPQLEAAMGIDLDIPEIAPMMPQGMTVPTAQMLNLFSPQDQQLIMAESSFRTGLSQEDISSVIHRQRPGAPGGQMLSYGGGR
ncbi:hypothetical protein CMI37_13670 [Candidatus Pacearchaeota archaeon]|nr:hypothetical protein [Candidatus Pacearchaeota archaeon]